MDEMSAWHGAIRDRAPPAATAAARMGRNSPLSIRPRISISDADRLRPEDEGKKAFRRSPNTETRAGRRIRQEDDMTSTTSDIRTDHATFDSDGINHVVCAMQLEMGTTPGHAGRNPNVLFLGGPQVTDVDALCEFSLSKNWSLFFASVDVADPAAGLMDVRAVVTDGVTQAATIAGGRLWKRDKNSPSVLLFPNVGALAKVTSKGRILIREMTGTYGDEGYELARAALAARCATRPGQMPVVGPVGVMPSVLDVRTLKLMFEMG